MAMWQHTCGVYVWRSVRRCKLDRVQLASPHRTRSKHVGAF